LGRPLQNSLFNGLIWPKIGFASIAYAAMAARRVSSPDGIHPTRQVAWGPGLPSFLARQETRLAAILRCASVASDAASIASGLFDRHRGRNGAGS